MPQTLSRGGHIDLVQFQILVRRGFARDYEWAIAGAREEGVDLGVLVSQVQLLQSLLGEANTPTGELLTCSTTQLSAQLADLQSRLRSREA